MKQMHLISTILCGALSASSSAAAPFATIDGRLFVDGVGVDDVVDVAIDVTDDGGTSRLSSTENGVVVVDGAFAIDIDLASLAGRLADGEVLTVELGFDDLVATTTIGAVFSSRFALEAGSTPSADVAERLGTIAPASLIQAPTLQTAGAVTIAFGNLTGVPTGIADDDDQGNVDGVGAGLEIAAGTLRLTAIGGANIVDRSVTTAAFAANTLTSSNIAGLTSADVAAASITGAKVANGIVTGLTGVAGTGRVIFRITDPACDRSKPPLTTSSFCIRRGCRQANDEVGLIVCGTSATCGSRSSPTCDNARLGHVLFVPQD